MLSVPKLLFRAKIPGRSGAKHCIVRIIMSLDVLLVNVGISVTKSPRKLTHTICM